MTEILKEMESFLSDLMQTGFSTGAEPASRRAEALAESCCAAGLHTAGILMQDISQNLSRRSHQARKDDAPLMDSICRSVRYLELAREKLQQQNILDRWEILQQNKQEVNHESEGSA